MLRKLLSRVPIEATTRAKVQSKNDLKLRLSVYLITVYLIIRKFSNPFILLHFINVVTLRIYIMYFGKYADLYKFDVTACLQVAKYKLLIHVLKAYLRVVFTFGNNVIYSPNTTSVKVSVRARVYK